MLHEPCVMPARDRATRSSGRIHAAQASEHRGRKATLLQFKIHRADASCERSAPKGAQQHCETSTETQRYRRGTRWQANSTLGYGTNATHCPGRRANTRLRQVFRGHCPASDPFGCRSAGQVVDRRQPLQLTAEGAARARQVRVSSCLWRLFVADSTLCLWLFHNGPSNFRFFGVRRPKLSTVRP